MRNSQIGFITERQTIRDSGFRRGSIAMIVSRNAGVPYAPIIDATGANQNVMDSTPVTPFSGVTIVNPNTGATQDAAPRAK